MLCPCMVQPVCTRARRASEEHHEGRGTRGGLVGDDGRVASVGQCGHRAVGPRDRGRRRDPHDARELDVPVRLHASRSRSAPPTTSRRRSHGADVVVVAVPSRFYRSVLELAAPLRAVRRRRGQRDQGHRADNVSPHDRGDRRGLEPRSGKRGCSGRTESGPRGDGRTTVGHGHRVSRGGALAARCSVCS